MVADPQRTPVQQTIFQTNPKLFAIPAPAPPPKASKKKAAKNKGLTRGEFEHVNPPDLAQESALWLTGQRSVAEQRGKRYVPASVKHPGKMQPDVCGAIVDTYTEPGQHLVDFMGGICTTGVEGAERGRHVTVIELVRHWANVAYANAVRTMYRGAPGSIRVLCGDARALPKMLASVAQYDAAVVSPPYGEALEPRTGRVEGRIERLQQLIADGVLDPTKHDSWARKVANQGKGVIRQAGLVASVSPVYDADQERHSADAVLTSPWYGEGHIYEARDVRNMRRMEGRTDQGPQYDAALCSPVYGDSRISPIPSGVVYAENGEIYPGNLPRGYDAALVSPPFGPTQTGRGMALTGINGDGRPPIERGIGVTYDAAVVSPPYDSAEGNGGGRGLEPKQPTQGEWTAYENGAGPSPGWRGYQSRAYTPVVADAAIVSPAYGDIRQDGGSHQFGDNSAMENYSGEQRVKSRGQRDQSNVGNKKYGTMEKALSLVARLKAGETIPETEWPGLCYLEDMALIYHNAHGILKKGGLIILVLKDYRRDKRRVNLVGDTMRLLEAVGFVYHDRALAMTSKVEGDAGAVKVISKVSPFVRVNARKPEKNGGKVLLPAGEEVLVYRKE